MVKRGMVIGYHDLIKNVSTYHIWVCVENENEKCEVVG
jgi:hypothetical protein